MEKMISMNEMERPIGMEKGKLNFSINTDQLKFFGRHSYIDLFAYTYISCLTCTWINGRD